MSYLDIIKILTVTFACAFVFLMIVSTRRLYEKHSIPAGRISDRTTQRAGSVILEPSFESGPPASEALQELGWLVFRRGDFGEAAALFRRALAIHEQAQGPEHLDVAAALQGLGASLRQLGEFAQAKPLLERALAIRERVLGADHPAVAAMLQELGWLAFDRGDRSEAAGLFQRALAIREQAQGPEHLDVAAAFQGLAASLRQLGEVGRRSRCSSAPWPFASECSGPIILPSPQCCRSWAGWH